MLQIPCRHELVLPTASVFLSPESESWPEDFLPPLMCLVPLYFLHRPRWDFVQIETSRPFPSPNILDLHFQFLDLPPPLPSTPAADLATVGSKLCQTKQLFSSNMEDESTSAPAGPPARTSSHLSHDAATNLKRSDPFQFGSRTLGEQDDVFEFNAWDHVETDETYKEYAELQYAKQRESPVSDFDRSKSPGPFSPIAPRRLSFGILMNQR